MTLDEYQARLLGASSDAELLGFCQNALIHGTPFVFRDRETEFFEFKKRICDHFKLHHTSIFVVGSAKLGFSPHKLTDFSTNSDIDIAIVSSELIEAIDAKIADLQYRIRASLVSLSSHQNDQYNEYLRYRAIGWVRPDKIPFSSPTEQFKKDWFEFFSSISFDKAEVGNYKVSAGVFLSQQHLELYCLETAEKIRSRLQIEQSKGQK